LPLKLGTAQADAEPLISVGIWVRLVRSHSTLLAERKERRFSCATSAAVTAANERNIPCKFSSATTTSIKRFER
jgi:hypothetical protein